MTHFVKKLTHLITLYHFTKVKGLNQPPLTLITSHLKTVQGHLHKTIQLINKTKI